MWSRLIWVNPRINSDKRDQGTTAKLGQNKHRVPRKKKPKPLQPVWFQQWKNYIVLESVTSHAILQADSSPSASMCFIPCSKYLLIKKLHPLYKVSLGDIACVNKYLNHYQPVWFHPPYKVNLFHFSLWKVTSCLIQLIIICWTIQSPN